MARGSKDTVTLFQLLGITGAATIDNRAAVNMLSEMGIRAKDVRKVSTRVRSIYRRAEKQRFDARGPGWASLAPATVARKARAHLDPRILRARHDLFNSLVKSRAANQVNVKRPDSFRFGTSVPYARYHEYAKPIGRAQRMPLRELVGLSEHDLHDVAVVLSDFIVLGASGGEEV